MEKAKKCWKTRRLEPNYVLTFSTNNAIIILGKSACNSTRSKMLHYRNSVL